MTSNSAKYDGRVEITLRRYPHLATHQHFAQQQDQGVARWHLKQIPEQTLSMLPQGQELGKLITSFGSITSLAAERGQEVYMDALRVT